MYQRNSMNQLLYPRRAWLYQYTTTAFLSFTSPHQLFKDSIKQPKSRRHVLDLPPYTLLLLCVYLSIYPSTARSKFNKSVAIQSQFQSHAEPESAGPDRTGPARFSLVRFGFVPSWAQLVSTSKQVANGQSKQTPLFCA